MADFNSIRSAVATAITSLAPSVASSVLFVAHDDPTCRLESTTEPGRFRLFVVAKGRPALGGFAWGDARASYDLTILVRVGYPVGQYEDVGGTLIDIDSAKSSDFEQIDAALVGGAPFAALEDVTLVRLRDAYDESGGRVRTIAYGVDYRREV